MLQTIVDLGGWSWLILAGLLMILEVLAPGIFLIWVGVGAAVLGVLSLILGGVFPWEAQLLAFGIFSAIAAWLGRDYYGNLHGKTDQPHLNERNSGLVGHTGTLIEDTADGTSRIRLGDTTWRVKTGAEMKAGTRVRVISHDGTTLHVEAV